MDESIFSEIIQHFYLRKTCLHIYHKLTFSVVKTKMKKHFRVGYNKVSLFPTVTTDDIDNVLITESNRMGQVGTYWIPALVILIDSEF